MKNKFSSGYRFFHCDECDHLFDEASRDCESPSLTSCPMCRNEVFPYGFKKDDSLPKDKFGNLMD